MSEKKRQKKDGQRVEKKRTRLAAKEGKKPKPSRKKPGGPRVKT